MRVKPLILGLIASLFLFSPCPAKVISRIRVNLYSVYFYMEKQLPPTSADYVMTNFGPGNIKFLETVDIVLDKEGRVAGVQFIYKLPDGYRRKTFLSNVMGWTFKRAKRRGTSKIITLRLVTTDELNVPW